MAGNKITVAAIKGWLLIAPDDEVGGTEWHIAWLDPFASKRKALMFAVTHSWPKPYRAVRGKIAVSEKR